MGFFRLSMSRMLRGQATLQSIIGKSTITKRPGNVQRNAKSKARSAAEVSAATSAVPEPTPSKEDSPLSERDHGPEQLPEGFVECPVCGLALRGEDLQLNLHLGETAIEVPTCRTRGWAHQVKFYVLLIFFCLSGSY